MSRPPAPLPDALTSGFTRPVARCAGLGDGALARRAASGAARRLGPSLWAPAALDRELAVLSAAQRLIPAAVASHASAARIWVVRAGDVRAHLTVPTGPNLRTAPGFVVHRDRLAETEAVRRHGLRVTEPYRTAVDVARSEPFVTAVTVVDAFLWAELVEREELIDRLVRWRARRGVVAARRAITASRYGAASPAETRLRLALLARGIPEPSLQHAVQTPGGVLAADLAWPAARFALEYDGVDPHSLPGSFVRDRQRWGWFRDAGWELRVVTAEDLRRPDVLAASVRRLLGIG